MTAANVVHGQAYDTLTLTWVNCGAAPSRIVSNLYDTSETLVSSVAGVSSGNGYYYAPHTLPGSAQWLVNRWWATINANTYARSQFVEVQEMRV
jgi:hypothetical protein